MTEASGSMKSDRVLIVGGAGFVGRHLVESLAPRCQEVVVASRSETHLPGTRALPVDLSQYEAVRQLLHDVRPTVVFNLAGRRPASAAEDPRETIDLNLLGAVELVYESTLLGVRRVVLVGSAEEYGDQAMPVSEDAPLRPHSTYGASKAAMTLHALALHRASNAPVVVVRPFSIYGPGAPLHMFVAEAVDCAARGVPFQMTDGAQRRDLIHVTDVVRGLLAAASVPEAVGGVYNLGSGASHSMKDVAQALWRISATTAELQVGRRAKPAGDLKETCANIDRARNILGWQPGVSLEEGLRTTWLAARRRTREDLDCLR